MQFLLFQVYAPLVSWGEIAVGGERRSSRHPSKSAITGLVSAALGIKRDEEQKLNALADSIGVAVLLHSGGSVLKDFHTAQVPKSKKNVAYHSRKAELEAPIDDIGTILSRREYRCDALSIVAVYLKDEKTAFSLSEIETALKMPRFHLYFGRKSAVPALPLAPKQANYTTLKEAFDNYDVIFPKPIGEEKPAWLHVAFEQYSLQTIFGDSNVSCFWEDGVKSGFETLQSVERYDQPLSRRRWQFTSRIENMTVQKREVTNVSQ